MEYNRAKIEMRKLFLSVVAFLGVVFFSSAKAEQVSIKQENAPINSGVNFENATINKHGIVDLSMMFQLQPTNVTGDGGSCPTGACGIQCCCK